MKGSLKGFLKGAGKVKQLHQPAKGTGKQATLQRERVVKGRVAGKVASWKGAYGFVVPDIPIDHPMASRRGGKIYLDQADVEQELSGIGAAVTFFVYCDDSGLGAEKVIPNRSGMARVAPVKKTIEKQHSSASFLVKGRSKGLAPKKAADEAESRDKSSRIMITEAPITGVVDEWRGQMGWIKPDEAIENEEFQNKPGRRKGMLFAHISEVDGEAPLTNASVMFSVYQDERGFGACEVQLIEQGDGVDKKNKSAAEQPKSTGMVAVPAAKSQVKPVKKVALKDSGKSKGKGKAGKAYGKGKEQKDKGPSGPDLPRERLTDSPITGEVISYRGKFGWVQPTEELTFDGAVEKHGGKIYAHVQDVLEAETEPLKVGDSVQFHVYRDQSGLGAEEVIRL